MCVSACVLPQVVLLLALLMDDCRVEGMLVVLAVRGGIDVNMHDDVSIQSHGNCHWGDTFRKQLFCAATQSCVVS